MYPTHRKLLIRFEKESKAATYIHKGERCHKVPQFDKDQKKFLQLIRLNKAEANSANLNIYYQKIEYKLRVIKNTN